MRILLLLGCLTTSFAIVKAQAGGGIPMSAGEDRYHASLQLTTSIMEQNHCSSGEIQYLLNFKFRNVGKKIILLDRLIPVVTNYMVSASEKKALERKYEANTHVLIGINNAGFDETRIVVLKSGESYDVKERFSVSADDDKDKPLRPGTHFLQVVVSTWDHPLSNIEWRQKLTDKGYLWTDSILSEPMPFIVPNRPFTSTCQ